MDYHQARWSPVGERQSVTVRDLVFAARGSRRRWRNLATLLEIGGLLGRSIGSLSNGEMRKVLLARALVKEPPLVILDEPCQGLDPAHRQRVLAILDQVAREPHSTVIYVTHHRAEIPVSFGHELRLHRGRAAYCGVRQPAQ